jgi:hypothetical protein
MTNDDILIRVEKFERMVATCLCVLPALFAAQCFFVALSCPVFEDMFKDFGAKLPLPTQFAMRTWGFWAVFAVAVPIVALIVSRKSKPTFSLIFSTVSGIGMFVIAQVFTGSLFLPIFQLGAVASGLK